VNTEDAIAKLADDLDAWFEDGRSTLALPDRLAQGRAIDRGIRIVPELDRLKAEGMAAIGARLARANSEPGDTQVASLIDAFRFSSRLADTLHDELLDTDGEHEVWRLMDTIVRILDRISRGRAALDALLDNPSAGVRVAAGAYLIDLDPQRVIPILREIDEKGRGKSADFGAHWTLLAWERERMSRFKSLSRGIASSHKDRASSPD
jgi:hypothetical protein